MSPSTLTQRPDLATPTDQPLTIEQYAQSETPERSELVRGTVVDMPSPKPLHGWVSSEVVYLLKTWGRQAGFEVFDNSGVATENEAAAPGSVRGPDSYAIRRQRITSLTDYFAVPPELCVEVRSPSETLTSLRAKADEYLAFGVAVVWCIDPEGEWLEVSTQAGRQLFDAGEMTPPHEALPGLSLAIADFFPRFPIRDADASNNGGDA